jgi:hypothetical protein
MYCCYFLLLSHVCSQSQVNNQGQPLTRAMRSPAHCCSFALTVTGGSSESGQQDGKRKYWDCVWTHTPSHRRHDGGHRRHSCGCAAGRWASRVDCRNNNNSNSDDGDDEFDQCCDDNLNDCYDHTSFSTRGEIVPLFPIRRTHAHTRTHTRTHTHTHTIHTVILSIDANYARVLWSCWLSLTHVVLSSVSLALTCCCHVGSLALTWCYHLVSLAP